MCILFGHMQLTYHSHHLIVLISLFVPTLQYLTLLALVHFSPMEHKQSTPIIIVLSAGITCSALPDIMNGTINYLRGTTAPYDFGTTTTYQCNYGHVLTSGDSERTCTGDGSTPSGSGLWDGAAPQCPCMLYYCIIGLHDNVHKQLWTVVLLRLLSMDLLGYQQPQHSQGQ